MKECKKCGSEFPSAVKINGEVKNLGSRKFCLDCSPFGSRNTKDLSATKRLEVEKCCSSCKNNLPITDFYKRGRGDYTSECKECTKTRMHERQRANKKVLVAEHGGKCTGCGYSKSLNALTFHHIDPSTKKFGIGNHLSYNIDELRVEAKKCILLCCNCHAEEHDEDMGC